MTGSAVSRFVWKEYRVMRGFWISLAIMAVFVQAIVWLSWSESVLTAGLFGVALSGAALYALGSGATMFATEREEGTYDLLRGLPVTNLQVASGKLAFSVISIVAIGVVLWVSAWMLAGRRVPDAQWQHQLWSVFGLGALELLVWATFFSLLSSRPLQAALLGVVATSATISALIGIEGDWRLLHTLPPYVKVVPARLVILAVMAAVDIGLALRGCARRGQRRAPTKRLPLGGGLSSATRPPGQSPGQPEPAWDTSPGTHGANRGPCRRGFSSVCPSWCCWGRPPRFGRPLEGWSPTSPS